MRRSDRALDLGDEARGPALLQEDKSLVPFLKWPGGKRWFVVNYSDLLPQRYGTYIEPFLGAGSIYFHMRPARALLGDVNSDLINAYQAIRNDWQAVLSSLKYRQRRHREDPDWYYYWLRNRNISDSVRQASKFIYLNRTCFNGIYRVNLDGQFNVPRGTKDNVILESDEFEETATLLKNAELFNDDFEVLLNQACNNDFVFCDPPYTIQHNYNGFLKYNEVLFTWKDQERLADALERAVHRGVKVLCTNANHKSVRALYNRPGFIQRVVSRFSRISADKGSRRYFEELVIRSNI